MLPRCCECWMPRRIEEVQASLLLLNGYIERPSLLGLPVEVTGDGCIQLGNNFD